MLLIASPPGSEVGGASVYGMSWWLPYGPRIDRCLLCGEHDDVRTRKRFPHYWPFVRGFTGHRWIPSQRASNAKFYCTIAVNLNKLLIKHSICSRWRSSNVTAMRGLGRWVTQVTIEIKETEHRGFEVKWVSNGDTPLLLKPKETQWTSLQRIYICASSYS